MNPRIERIPLTALGLPAAGAPVSGVPPIAAITASTPAFTAASRSPARMRGTMSDWMMRPARASGISPSSP